MIIKVKKTLAIGMILLIGLSAESKNDPKTKCVEKNQHSIIPQNKIETVSGSLSSHRVGRYLFVSYQKSSNVCMVINRDIKTESGNIHVVKIFPDNGPSKTYRFIKSTPYLQWNLDGSMQLYTCFVLPTQE